jgi:F0F1-type ATP synthase membrane subunit b/b'
MNKRIANAAWVMVVILLFTTGACKKAPEGEGPAEQVGKQIDQSMAKAGQEVGKALESAGEAVKQAGQEVKKETKN